MKNKLHTYNIIKKHGKGNINGSVYTIEYQVDGLPQRYMTDMLCIGSENRVGKFAWFEGTETPFIITNKDKDNFIKELAEYQKGSSYRKQNPIIYSEVEQLQEKRDILYKDIQNLDKQIENKIREEQTQRLNEYRKEASKEYDCDVVEDLREHLNDFKYDIRPISDVYIDYKFYNGLYLVSRKTKKVVCMLVYDEYKHYYKLADIPDKLLAKIK